MRAGLPSLRRWLQISEAEIASFMFVFHWYLLRQTRQGGPQGLFLACCTGQNCWGMLWTVLRLQWVGRGSVLHILYNLGQGGCLCEFRLLWPPWMLPLVLPEYISLLLMEHEEDRSAKAFWLFNYQATSGISLFPVSAILSTVCFSHQKLCLIKLQSALSLTVVFLFFFFLFLTMWDLPVSNFGIPSFHI